MTLRHRLLAGLILGSSLVCGEARADDEAPTDDNHHFYKGYDYGSQSLFSPLFVIWSRGFDVLQLRPKNRNPFSQNWTRNIGNVLGNVADPFRAISADGWGTFTKQELLPLSYSSGTARWAPNYSLHLIGGGESYAEMREWFLAHDAGPEVATIFSIASLYTAAIINESIENKDQRGFNTDCLADLLVFDSLGIVLFSIAPVRRFLSSTFILSDWSMQPVISYPHGDLEGMGNFYSLKFPLPFYPRLRLFAYGGFQTLGGASFVIDKGWSISAAAGVRVGNFNDQKTTVIVDLQPAGAVFLDKNESLMASVHLSNVPDNTVTLSMYPNAFFHTTPGIGGFFTYGRDGAVVAGLSFTHGIGLGIGVSAR